VEAVEALNNETGASATAVSTRLGLDKSTASRRLKAAEKAGYLYNAEARLGVPAKWMIGEDLPHEASVLPEVDQLLAAYSMAA
jgi:DNA-binding IclR family transcriptional regulator